MAISDSLGTVSTALGLAGTSILIWKWSAERYKVTLGSRQGLRGQLLLLSCGVTLDYVKQLFGTPTMQFQFPEVKGLVQRAYWLEHAWLSILTKDEDDAVSALVVVVTDPKFRLQLTGYSNGL